MTYACIYGCEFDGTPGQHHLTAHPEGKWAKGELPYPEPGGEEFTAGHSGTDTSKERAVSEARSGTTQRRMDQVLAWLAAVGSYGMTVADVRETTGWHHGSASSALTVLHKAGKIARLSETRDRCKVYVYPDFVGERETENYHRRGIDPAEVVKAVNRGDLDSHLIEIATAVNKRWRPNG